MELPNLQRNRLADRAVQGLATRCPHSPACPWEGPLVAQAPHLDDCLEGYVPCEYGGCLQQVRRSALGGHREFCSQRAVVCALCGLEHAFDAAGAHEATCADAPVACLFAPHGCAAFLPRREMGAHHAAAAAEHAGLCVPRGPGPVVAADDPDRLAAELAVREEPWTSALEHAAPRLLANRAFVLEHVRLKSGNRSFSFAPLFHGDRQVALAALRHCDDGDAVSHLPAVLAEDRTFLVAALAANGSNLALDAFASLRSDRAAVAVAVRSSPVDALMALDGLALASDPAIAMEAVRRDGLALACIPAKARTRAVVITAVQHDGAALQHAPAALRSDEAVALEVVRGDGLLLRYVLGDARASRVVALAAVRSNGLALRHARSAGSSTGEGGAAAAAMNDDAEVVAAALESDPRAIYFASQRLVARLDPVPSAERGDAGWLQARRRHGAACDPAERLKLYCKHFDGRTVTLDAFASDCIIDLKALIHLEEGLPPDKQKLMLPNPQRQLKNEQTVASYGIRNEGTLQLFPRGVSVGWG